MFSQVTYTCAHILLKIKQIPGGVAESAETYIKAKKCLVKYKTEGYL